MCTKQCPCGWGKDYQDCCGALIEGRRIAQTPEELMRSRYSAFVNVEINYLMETHAKEFRPADPEEISDWAASVEWLGLEVIDTKKPDSDSGWVEFKANFQEAGKRSVIHENSFFRREGGRWLYVNGETPSVKSSAVSVKIERNAPCPCGSGKKYKKCCMRE